MLTVHRMEMRGRMVVGIHSDRDAVKDTYGQHCVSALRGLRPKLQGAADDSERADLDRLAVAVGDDLVGERGDAASRGEDAHEVERVAAVDVYCLAGLGSPTDGPQALDRLGERELFADEARHEAAAPDLAPGFEPAVDAEQHPPRRRLPFASQQVTEPHAVA